MLFEGGAICEGARFEFSGVTKSVILVSSN
jgi:hypothetical protein